MKQLLYFEFQLPTGILIVDQTNPRLAQLYNNYKLNGMSTDVTQFESMKEATPVDNIDSIMNEEPISVQEEIVIKLAQ
jgi:hypothetical protein